MGGQLRSCDNRVRGGEERVALIMCAPDANQRTATCLRCPKAHEGCGPHPLSSDIVLKCPDVGSSDDDRETAIQVRDPGRAITESQELGPDVAAARVRECSGWPGSWQVMPGPALSRPLTWSPIETN
jgi:hypothetical protein